MIFFIRQSNLCSKFNSFGTFQILVMYALCLGVFLLHGCNGDTPSQTRKSARAFGGKKNRAAKHRDFMPASVLEMQDARAIITRHWQALEKGDFQEAMNLLHPQWQRFYGNANNLKVEIKKKHPEYLEPKTPTSFAFSRPSNTDSLWVNASFKTSRGQRVRVFYILKRINKIYVINTATAVNLNEPLSKPTPAPYDPFRVTR